MSPGSVREASTGASVTLRHTLWTVKESVCSVLRHLVGSILLEQPRETEVVLEAANLGAILYLVHKSYLLGQEDDLLVS